MSEDRLHVVFGTGQVGRAVANLLAESGHPVRAASRHRPCELANDTIWHKVAATDAAAVIQAAAGATGTATAAEHKVPSPQQVRRR